MPVLDLVALFSPLPPPAYEPSIEEVMAEVNGDAFIVLPEDDEGEGDLWGFWRPPS